MSDPTDTEPHHDPHAASGPGASGEEGSPPPRRLTRRTDDRVLGGVASGLADYFGIDPLVTRLVFVGLALYGGLGIIGYLVCWVVIPADGAESRGSQPASGEPSGDRAPARVVGVVLLVVAALLFLPGLFGVLTPDILTPGRGPWPGPVLWPFSPSVLVAIVLIVVGIAVYQAGRRDPETGDAQAPHPQGSSHGVQAARGQAPAAPPADHGASAPQDPPPAGGGHGPAGPPPAVQPRPEAPQPAPSPRPSSPLGRLTLAAALLVTGVAALLDRTTTLGVGASDLLGLALLTVGLGLLVGAWWGRARWLIAVGFALLPFAVVALLLPMPAWRAQGFEAAAGERFHQPTSMEELRGSYSLAAGRLVVDLSELELPEDTETEVSVAVTTGQIEVLLPPDADVELSGRTLVGAVRFPERQAAGLVVTEDRVDTAEGDALLRLDLSARVGEISVRRPAEAAETSWGWPPPGSDRPSADHTPLAEEAA